ncbi:MAG: hypothetical protein KF862_14540 [Chitinophagaceae bacterium]|nr:hypothetical protein [Chitinophagaceae bacterium]
MKSISAVVLFVLVIVSCSKDKFESRPRLTFKEMKGNYVPVGNEYAARIVLEYTDAEGDIAGVPLFFEKISSSAPCANSSLDPNIPPDTVNVFLRLPGDVPPSSDQKGEIEVILKWTELNPIACNPNDTLEDATLKFWFKDKAGNMSDTVTVPPIRIEKVF